MSSKAPMQDEIAAKAAISSFRKETHPRRQTKEEERRSAAYPCPQSEDRTSRLAPPIPRSGLVQGQLGLPRAGSSPIKTHGRMPDKVEPRSEIRSSSSGPYNYVRAGRCSESDISRFGSYLCIESCCVCWLF